MNPRARLWLIALVAACGPADTDATRILRRASRLRWMPLPNVPSSTVGGVFVNSEVPRLLVATAPSGAEVFLEERLLGTTPFETETRNLLTDVKGAPFPMQVKIRGSDVPIAAYGLRYEAAMRLEGVSPDDLPPPLPNRDLWLYLVVKKQP